MAHFAVLNESNIVTEVVVVNNEVITDVDGVEQEQLGIDFLNELLGERNYLQTSYNHSFRKLYAGKGSTYDPVKDIFIEPEPYPSWSLDENDDWQPPIPYPEDGDGHLYWDEAAYQADNATGWEVVPHDHER